MNNFSPANSSRPVGIQKQSVPADIFDAPILFSGLVRNCATNIRENLLRLSVALKHFRNIHWLVIESDSSDNTLQVLEHLQTEITNFQFITLGQLSTQYPLRTARIAHCRNQYLKALRTNPVYKDVRYLVVADLDGVNDLLTEEAFASCWTHDEWSVCAANQSGPYYDVFALRHPVWCPVDPLVQQKFLQAYVGYEDALKRCVASRMIRIPRDAEWIEVESAFGGLAIYKREALMNAHYVGLDGSGREICEHVTFHEQIRTEGFRIFINPALINANYTEHTSRYRFYPTLKRETKRFVKRILGRPD